MRTVFFEEEMLKTRRSEVTKEYKMETTAFIFGMVGLTFGLIAYEQGTKLKKEVDKLQIIVEELSKGNENE